MPTTNIYKKINEWDEYCPKCGIITYFKSQEQRNRLWVGECVRCALLSGEYKANFDPRIKDLTMKRLYLLRYRLTINKKGKIVEINKNHGSN